MRWLSDTTIEHLRQVADWPDLSDTKYEAIEKIGQGGMASVYRVKDRDLDREVALKVLRLAVPDPKEHDRALREARVLARLEHPGIVPVHDSGVLPDGRIYYTMKLVRGQRLDEHIKRLGSLSERLRIFQRICDGVAFAHAHGVIHRDLKPANIMVGPFGEVLVMDWGVAKLLTLPCKDVSTMKSAGSSLESNGADPVQGGSHSPLGPVDNERIPSQSVATSHGTVIGTPGYMSPEQERGEVGEIDQRSDVYALGFILRFLITGIEGDEARGRESQAPRALLAICNKALMPQKNQRYQTVPELANEVERFVAGLRVGAYPEGMLDQARRLVSKYRTPLLLLMAYLIVRVLLIFFSRT